MKLRNKKTGIMGELYYEPDKEYHFTVATEDPADMTIHKTLAQLNEVWEDYKPAEPLIKDEKIRKAVRAWAEVCGLSYVTYKQASNEFYDPDTRGAFAIRFRLIPVEVYLEDGECYTIAELCGEEEG